MNQVAEGLLTTIGLEVHVELRTKTKLFCGCPVGFGGEPNTRVCPVCLGHPGTLPVLNERAVEFTNKIGMALGCTIEARSVFHRKNYFYPDMPKNYQISQYDLPVGVSGRLDIEANGRAWPVGITRVHLEEDTGKSIHVGGGGRIHEAEYSLEDFNRAGTPLVEIVTEPDITSPEMARAFAAELRAILESLEVSDVRMEEGSMRIDANISVAPSGQRGAKAEIKNMNSLRSLLRALEFEQGRQKALLEKGAAVEQSTRHWDEKSGQTKPLRTKEEAFDYRYFPEPDLVPVEPSVEWLRQLHEELPELPSQRRHRFVEELGLSPYDAGVLVSSKWLGDLYQATLEAAKVADPKQIANWVANDLIGALPGGLGAEEGPRVDPVHMAELVDLVAGGTISKTQGQQVLATMIRNGGSPKELVEAEGMQQVSDREQLGDAIDQVIKANQEVATRIAGGDEKPFGFLMGQVMKATRGQGNPQVIRQMLREKLGMLG
ncbi:MAG TPA: Asp-tRNA(Asn)/Glu-tRNA(Gln) amidotransferase subunit GatB [Actinomycetota bacterium]|nr:Asp-tRNA(Asn)/Glu-tRNA(Gln) amidotransferase subunit GatB [Actinomycetota bacterium]